MFLTSELAVPISHTTSAINLGYCKSGHVHFCAPHIFRTAPEPKNGLAFFLTMFVSPFSSPLLTPQSSRRCVCNFFPMR
jgi:hypothetical protein